MAEWSQLPGELLYQIAQNLDFDIDLLRFRSVCSSWRSSVALQSRQRPSRSQILPNDAISDTSWGFYLSKRTIFRLELPPSAAQTLPSDAWMVKLEQGFPPTMSLFNPLCGLEFKPLPSSFPKTLDLWNVRVSELGHEYVLQYINYRPFANSIGAAGSLYMEKVALRSTGPSSFVLLTIHVSGKLALFGSGENKWTVIDELTSPYDDVILFQGQFYAVDSTGRTVIVTIDSSPSVNLAAHSVFGGDKKFLVESLGELLMVDMYVRLGPEDDPSFDEGFDFYYEFDRCMRERTVLFMVFKLDREGQKWVELKSLGDRMLFLGDNCTFSCSASDFPGCLGNCIFFTDNFFYSNSEGDGVMKDCGVGVFNLDDRSIVSLANCSGCSKLFWPPPAWVSSTMVAVGMNKLSL